MLSFERTLFYCTNLIHQILSPNMCRVAENKDLIGPTRSVLNWEKAGLVLNMGHVFFLFLPFILSKSGGGINNPCFPSLKCKKNRRRDLITRWLLNWTVIMGRIVHHEGLNRQIKISLSPINFYWWVMIFESSNYFNSIGS